MIKVNLLPPEYRKVERTPVLRFVTIVCGVILSASAIGAFLYVHFAMLVTVVSEREQLEETYTGKKVEAEKSKALEREKQEYQKRRNTIEQIARNRILWSRKLDELCDIIHNKGDTRRHLVWLDEIRTSAARRGRGRGKDAPASPGTLYIRGYSGGEEIRRLSDFHRDIKESQFFEDFLTLDNPEGQVVTFSDDRVPKSAWQFDFNMVLKPYNWREKAR